MGAVGMDFLRPRKAQAWGSAQDVRPRPPEAQPCTEATATHTENTPATSCPDWTDDTLVIDPAAEGHASV